MRVLCTGGAGYVGSACLRWLLAHGHEAFAYDNLSAGNRAAVPETEQRLVVGDLTDSASLSATLEQLEIEAVMHFAALASVPESVAAPESYWRTNVVGTKNLLDAMRACRVAKLIFSSTAATYAFTDRMPLTEASEQNPATPYGTTKLACEAMIRDYHNAYGLQYTIMRYFNASGADPDGEYGEDRKNESHLIPLVLYVPMGRREKVLVYGDDWGTRDGTCVRDYVHNDDIAQAHQLALDALAPGVARTYNIGTDRGVTVLEVVRACEKVLGAKIPVEFAPRRPGDPAILVASCDKVKAELGWRPRYDTIEAIVETAYAWHRKYPNGYADKRA
ncbi:MAG: UDP-glucose 4-epimerase GalE [Myxococcales bacterium]|nr:UDP-glucose 4-epimerase GalE [Myxococcales bacterium]